MVITESVINGGQGEGRDRGMIVMDQILGLVSSVNFLSTFIILTSIEHYARGSDTQYASQTGCGGPMRGSQRGRMTNERLRGLS